MKFTGPLFVPGSKDPNWILFDRMLLVKDSVKNVLKKAGEQFVGKILNR